MALAPVYGHEDVRGVLVAAARAGTLAQSLLLHGPAGVGKQRVGLWMAQQLMCESPAPDGLACGRCQSCRMTARLEHPDVHWFFPLPRPDAATPEKLREKLEEARGAELAARRADPFHVPAYDRAPAYFMGTIQNLQRFATVRPAMGSRKVFVVGDAEAMVPQESSPEAANAFLKLLEEPPADTTLILTSSNPGALLPTIRSRVLPVRLLPLPMQQVADFMEREKGMPRADAERVAAISAGSIGKALRLLPGAGGAGVLQRQREAGRSLLQAATSTSAADRLAAANAVAPAGARGEFTGTLEALSLWLRDLMAVAAGASDSLAYTDDVALLQGIVTRCRVEAASVASALLRVQEARDLASGNVNPQLIVADLLRGIRLDLGPHPAA
ncbi:MAG: DNA polymerase III delta prime subunit [uncultured Gemmatimonadetes bacterium]|uniref:DNA polymerase III delta prime subunit n=1 Tax=uncultured Gemmatimonadota bacterium TaxID=203437 RepID=A0A6J4KLX1_9BACT|nr:MAG: DNA polymerase III delta prime subunit [uncultured Gemmatimonadota bacterium]